ncbi:MAG: NAD(P)H-binding protein [Acidobacteriota bacterium]
MSQPILVIGANGNVGGAVVTQLADAGHAVRAAARRPDSLDTPTSVSTIRLDYDDPASFAPALTDVQAVFAVAPPLDAHADKRMRPFLEAIRDHGTPRLVLLTAIGADDPDAGALYRLEHIAADFDIPRTVLRPNWFMDNFYPGYLYGTIKDQGAFYLPTDNAASALIAVDDIAACAVAALTADTADNRAYDLTGPEGLDHHQVARTLSELGGRNIRYVAVDEAAARAGMEGMDESAIDYMIDLYRRFRAGYAAEVKSGVRDLLGRDPIDFRTWAEARAEAFQA